MMRSAPSKRALTLVGLALFIALEGAVAFNIFNAAQAESIQELSTPVLQVRDRLLILLRLLTGLPAGNWAFVGRWFVHALRGVTRLFGDSEFSRAVFTAPTGQWSGPFRSGYGWHVVHIDARRAASTPSFTHSQ